MCTGAEMVLLVGTYVDTDMGARSFVALPAAAAGGCRYNIVTVSRLGSGSVRYSGATISVSEDKRLEGQRLQLRPSDFGVVNSPMR